MWAATRMRPVLEGQVPDEIITPQQRHRLDRWPERLRGHAIRAIDTHGKHLFIRFEGDLVLHSHLKMTGAWGVYSQAARWSRSRSRAWLVLSRGGRQVVQFDGPVLELMTESRSRFDLRLAALGPDVLAAEFDYGRFLSRLREDDPGRPIGDALLDQRTVAGIGNIWKSEGCWEAGVSPWRPVGLVSDEEARLLVERVRPRMLRSGTHGPRFAGAQLYRRPGRPCARCGTPIRSGPQGDGNRITYWCPGCQR